MYISNVILWLFLGIPFAYIYRIINTADSIVGFKDVEHINIGWFSARMDDLANYIPTRLSTVFMLISGKILDKDVKNAVKILKSDRNITESINAGWTMSTIAGLLNVQLEKIGKYKLGVSNRLLESNDILTAFAIYKYTVLLFSIFYVLYLVLLYIY